MSEHEHDTADTPELNDETPMDAASQSLADALRISFRLLTLLMIVVVILFLATGVKSIEPNQVGIVKIFGKQVSLARPGLTVNWPFPIGEIEIVEVGKEQKIELEDFWLHIAPKDRLKDPDDLRIVGEGLRPGWDGAVLSGDRSLLHLRLECLYTVRNPLACARQVTDLEEMVRSVVCAAVVHSAAERTADAVKTTATDEFLSAVRKDAQDRLDILLEATDAVMVKVTAPRRLWPLRARSAYKKAQQDKSERENIRNFAIERAVNILQEAAGTNYVALVGTPWEDPGVIPGENRGDNSAGNSPRNLIGQYAYAARSGDQSLAADLIRRINDVLAKGCEDPDRPGRIITTGGEAARILAEANAYRVAVVHRVRSRVRRFEQLLPEYRRNPEFMRHRLWADVREEIFNEPKIEKYFLTFGKGKVVWRISSDPEVREKLRLERLKAPEKEEEYKRRPEGPPRPPGM